MAASFDDDTQYNYGSAPYAEAANQGRARMSTLQRIAMLLAGAGQGIQSVQAGYGPLAAGLTGFSRSYAIGNASKRAAEEYAMKQQEAEERRRSRALDDEYQRAQIERSKRPEPAPPPPKTPTNVLDMDEDQFGLYMKRQAMLKAATTMPKDKKGGAKTPAAPKPSQSKMDKQMKELFALEQADDPNELIQVSNDANLEPETRRRAWAKYQRITKAVNPSQVR